MRKERSGPEGSVFNVHCTLNEKIFMKTGTVCKECLPIIILIFRFPDFYFGTKCKRNFYQEREVGGGV